MSDCLYITGMTQEGKLLLGGLFKMKDTVGVSVRYVL